MRRYHRSAHAAICGPLSAASEPTAKPRHFTDRPWLAYVLFVGTAALVAYPSIPKDQRDDFPLSPYGMFSDPKDEFTTITQAVAVPEVGTERAVPPRMLGTDEVLQARATLAKASRTKGASSALCEKVAARVAADGDFAWARRVEIRTVTYESISYFQDPPMPPVKRRVHARCEVKR